MGNPANWPPRFDINFGETTEDPTFPGERTTFTVSEHDVTGTAHYTGQIDYLPSAEEARIIDPVSGRELTVRGHQWEVDVTADGHFPERVGVRGNYPPGYQESVNTVASIAVDCYLRLGDNSPSVED